LLRHRLPDMRVYPDAGTARVRARRGGMCFDRWGMGTGCVVVFRCWSRCLVGSEVDRVCE